MTIAIGELSLQKKLIAEEAIDSKEEVETYTPHLSAYKFIIKNGNEEESKLRKFFNNRRYQFKKWQYVSIYHQFR